MQAITHVQVQVAPYLPQRLASWYLASLVLALALALVQPTLAQQQTASIQLDANDNMHISAPAGREVFIANASISSLAASVSSNAVSLANLSSTGSELKSGVSSLQEQMVLQSNALSTQASTLQRLTEALAYATSSSSGNLTIMLVKVLDDSAVVGKFTSLRLNASTGNPVVTYFDLSNNALKLIVCTDALCATTAKIFLDTDCDTSSAPSLALNHDGKPVVAYTSQTGALKAAFCSDYLCSTMLQRELVFHNGSQCRDASLQINLDNLPIVTYQDTGNKSLMLAFCAHATCATSIGVFTVDSDGDVGYHSSLQLSSFDTPFVAYFDSTRANLKLAICQTTFCNSKSVIVIDNQATSGDGISLKLTSENAPVLSYADATRGHLKIVVCFDSLCTNLTNRAVDSRATTGYYSSLQLSSDGVPFISYFSLALRDLELLKCSNVNCSGSPAIFTLDSEDDVGRTTSLAIDQSRGDQLVVTYFDLTHGRLKIAFVPQNALIPSEASPLVPTIATPSPSITTSATIAATTTTVVRPHIDTLDNSVNDAGLYNSLRINGNGNPVVAYYETTNKNCQLIVCQDSTCASSLKISLDTSGNTGLYTSLAIPASGLPVVAYYDMSAGDVRILFCETANCLSFTIKTLDSAGDVGPFMSLQLNSQGHPIMAYRNNTSRSLKLLICVDPMCNTFPTSRILDESGDTGYYASLQLSMTGVPHVAYYDQTTKNLRFAMCSSNMCDAHTIVTVDNATQVGAFVSLQFRSNNTAAMSYIDLANGDLKLALCGDFACQSVLIKALQTDGKFGYHTSLQLTIQDIPIISFYESSSLDLLLLRCLDAACIQSVVTDVDVEGDVGKYNSLQLDGAELPVIAYYDLTLGNLKIAYPA